MRTFRRVRVEDYNGDTFTLKQGKEYITSPEREDGTVTVFANFWAPVPAALFSGAMLFTES